MKFYGKAESSAKLILSAFQGGDVPKALSQVFVSRNTSGLRPCDSWSWSNQFLTALAGTTDARGFRQWQEVGRYVIKGAVSFGILAPLKKKVEKDGEESRFILYGFKSIPVFRIEDTDGKPIEQTAPSFLRELPLLDVAKAWGLNVTAYAGKPGKALGYYSKSGTIALGVENLATWAHELSHAADDRLGQLTERGQHWRSECVAELAGATLMLAMGFDRQADIGGAWDYISKYAHDAKLQPIAACQKVLDRVCNIVALILEESGRIHSTEAAA